LWFLFLNVFGVYPIGYHTGAIAHLAFSHLYPGSRALLALTGPVASGATRTVAVIAETVMTRAGRLMLTVAMTFRTVDHTFSLTLSHQNSFGM
jgi:hypothetical protein